MRTSLQKRLSSALCLCTFLFITAYSQSQTPVQGIIRDENQAPMAGVTVTIEHGTTRVSKSTQTGTDGSFSISGIDYGGPYNISLTYVGYADKLISNQQHSQANPLRINASMERSEAESLDDLVVVGYGRSNKRDVTGSVKSIKASEFNRGIINSPEELLQGKVAGVNVTSASGEPGGIQNITVRGPGGVRTGSTPLFVVDGMALDNSTTGGATNPLSFLSPQDIATIDVLKDASATAIYGARGANGVVLITTKRGRSGYNSMNYSYNAGISKLARALPVFEAGDFKREVAALGGVAEDLGASTNWQEEITRTAFTQNHNLALSGGANKLTYYASLGMQLQEGIIRKNDFKRYTGRINASQKFLDDRLVIDINLNATNTVNLRPPISGLIGNALSANPTYPAYDTDGGIFEFQNGINPLQVLQLEKDLTTINRVIGNISANLTILKGLDYKINFGIDNSTATRDIQNLPNLVPQRDGNLITLNNYNKNSLIENYLTWTYNSGEHRLIALAGHSYQKIFLQGRGTSINKFPISGVEPIYNPGIGQELTLANNRPTGYAVINELQSFFSRLNYHYKDRYLFTATVRADGSSKFGANNKYGVFPSFSGAWVVSQEEFFNAGFISSLKLRAGWGQTGNQEIPSKITQPLFTSQVSGSTSYPLYETGPYPAGTSYTRLANPNIQWEVSSQTDIGLDFGLFNEALSGTIDYFRKVSNNILLEVIPADPVQPASTFWTNVEDMSITNQGLEIDLNYRKITSGGLQYSIGGNITFINNEVQNSPYSVIPSGSASGAGLTSATINGYVNGEPIGTFFLQEFTGFNRDGISEYRDVNGDGIVNDKDRLALGTALPSKMFNLYGNIAYKGFDLTANFNGVSGNKVYDNTANSGFYKLLLSKGVNTTPEAIDSPEESVSNSAPVSSRYLKDAQFFRLNNLAIGYNVNTKSMALGKYITGMRISLTAQNLFVITPYNGYDPEVNTDRTINGISSYGIDYLSYPKARSFILGVNITL